MTDAPKDGNGGVASFFRQHSTQIIWSLVLAGIAWGSIQFQVQLLWSRQETLLEDVDRLSEENVALRAELVGLDRLLEERHRETRAWLVRIGSRLDQLVKGQDR